MLTITDRMPLANTLGQAKLMFAIVSITDIKTAIAVIIRSSAQVRFPLKHAA